MTVLGQVRKFSSWFVAAAICLIVGGSAAPASRPIVADLSNHLVAITTGFSGTDVLVFGATNEQPGEIVMVIRGPKETHVVREKDRIAGIWVNRHEAFFEQIPSFYAVASTAPMSEFVPLDVRKRHQIGLDALTLIARNSRYQPLPEPEAEKFRDALIRLKTSQGLYGKNVATVSTLENRLFRSELHLPATVPTGPYTVEVYFVSDGAVVGAEITPLFVSKTGFSAEIFDFATVHSAWYAIVCIIFAILAGWAVALVFKK